MYLPLDRLHLPVNAYDPNPLRGETIAANDDIDSYNTPLPQITLITKCDAPALMSKRIFLDGQGNLHSDGSECRSLWVGMPVTAGDIRRTCVQGFITPRGLPYSASAVASMLGR